MSEANRDGLAKAGELKFNLDLGEEAGLGPEASVASVEESGSGGSKEVFLAQLKFGEHTLPVVLLTPKKNQGVPGESLYDETARNMELAGKASRLELGRLGYSPEKDDLGEFVIKTRQKRVLPVYFGTVTQGDRKYWVVERAPEMVGPNTFLRPLDAKNLDLALSVMERVIKALELCDTIGLAGEDLLSSKTDMFRYDSRTDEFKLIDIEGNPGEMTTERQEERAGRLWNLTLEMVGLPCNTDGNTMDVLEAFREAGWAEGVKKKTDLSKEEELLVDATHAWAIDPPKNLADLAGWIKQTMAVLGYIETKRNIDLFQTLLSLPDEKKSYGPLLRYALDLGSNILVGRDREKVAEKLGEMSKERLTVAEIRVFASLKADFESLMSRGEKYPEEIPKWVEPVEKKLDREFGPGKPYFTRLGRETVGYYRHVCDWLKKINPRLQPGIIVQLRQNKNSLFGYEKVSRRQRLTALKAIGVALVGDSQEMQRVIDYLESWDQIEVALGKVRANKLGKNEREELKAKLPSWQSLHAKTDGCDELSQLNLLLAEEPTEMVTAEPAEPKEPEVDYAELLADRDKQIETLRAELGAAQAEIARLKTEAVSTPEVKPASQLSGKWRDDVYRVIIPTLMEMGLAQDAAAVDRLWRPHLATPEATIAILGQRYNELEEFLIKNPRLDNADELNARQKSLFELLDLIRDKYGRMELDV